jgi:TldD protein
VNYSESFFAQRFGITEHDLQRYLSEALSRGGDYADLYFEYLATTSISLDESIVKNATQGVSLGVGIRVLSGERTGYAYTDNLDPDRIVHAARTAACIADGPAQVDKTGFIEAPRRNLYPVLTAPADLPLAERVKLVVRADVAARAQDKRIFQVQAVYADSLKHVLVATSDGVLNFDRQPMARMNVSVLARENETSPPQRGYSGGGGRVGLDHFLTEKTPEQFAVEAARQAIVLLTAVDTPAGEQTVVLAPGWPGVLLHWDMAWKPTSIAKALPPIAAASASALPPIW